MSFDLRMSIVGCLRIGVVAAVLAFLPVALSLSDLRLGTEILIMLNLAMLWNLLAGYAGLEVVPPFRTVLQLF